MAKAQGPLKLRQKKAQFKTSFEFGEDELTYSFDNSRTRVGSNIPYHKIPDRTSYREVKLWWLTYAFATYMTVAGIALLYYGRINDLERMYAVVYFATLAFLFVCLVGLRRRAGGMTSIQLHPVLVLLHDGKQDVIWAEILKRRRHAMRTILAVVDFHRPYYEEASKFSWLRDEGVITEQEYKSARQKIGAMRDKPSLAPQGPGSLN